MYHIIEYSWQGFIHVRWLAGFLPSTVGLFEVVDYDLTPCFPHKKCMTELFDTSSWVLQFLWPDNPSPDSFSFILPSWRTIPFFCPTIIYATNEKEYVSKAISDELNKLESFHTKLWSYERENFIASASVEVIIDIRHAASCIPAFARSEASGHWFSLAEIIRNRDPVHIRAFLLVFLVDSLRKRCDQFLGWENSPVQRQDKQTHHQC